MYNNYSDLKSFFSKYLKAEGITLVTRAYVNPDARI